jgi:hypothetical protein
MIHGQDDKEELKGAKILIMPRLVYAKSIAPTVDGTNVGLDSVDVGGSDESACQHLDFLGGP